MDELDELDDRDITAALRRHADELTADVVDVDATFRVVRQRARGRRMWRTAAGGALAAAALIGVVAVTRVADEGDVVRTPATTPGPVTTPDTLAVPTTTVAPAPSTTPTSTVAVPAIETPTTIVPTTVVATTDVPTTVETPTTAASTTVAPTPIEPVTTTYDSAGGSITVRLADGTAALVGDPAPNDGFTVRIDDNGPDRVRVRFESAGGRSEIRVDVEDGRLVPTITED